MNPEFFKITFDRIGFAFHESPMGAQVLIEWQGKDIVGKIWSASYTPERGYYAIGVRAVNEKLGISAKVEPAKYLKNRLDVAARA